MSTNAKPFPLGVEHKSLHHNGIVTFRVTVLQTLKIPKCLIASYLHSTLNAKSPRIAITAFGAFIS